MLCLVKQQLALYLQLVSAHSCISQKCPLNLKSVQKPREEGRIQCNKTVYTGGVFVLTIPPKKKEE